MCIITNTLPGIKISLNGARLCRNGAQLAAQRQDKQEADNGSACHDEARSDGYVANAYKRTRKGTGNKAGGTEDGTGSTGIVALAVEGYGRQRRLHQSEAYQRVDICQHDYPEGHGRVEQERKQQRAGKHAQTAEAQACALTAETRGHGGTNAYHERVQAETETIAERRKMIHLLHDERRRGYVGKEHKEARHLGHDGKSEAIIAENAEQSAGNHYHAHTYVVGQQQTLSQEKTAQ